MLSFCLLCHLYESTSHAKNIMKPQRKKATACNQMKYFFMEDGFSWKNGMQLSKYWTVAGRENTGGRLNIGQQQNQ
jgi:hypothetical protein